MITAAVPGPRRMLTRPPLRVTAVDANLSRHDDTACHAELMRFSAMVY